MTLTEMYEAAFDKGYAGVFAWSDKANDGHGTYESIATATRAFAAAHPSLVKGKATDALSPRPLIPAPGPMPEGTRFIYDLRGTRIPASSRARGVHILCHLHTPTCVYTPGSTP